VNKVFVIAEAGVNHNGDIALAEQLIDVAVLAGADAVKFQTWKTDLLVSKHVKQAEYQIKNMGYEESQYELLKRLELSNEAFLHLYNYCKEKNIIFMSTPDDVESARFLQGLQKYFKIGSGGLNDLHLLEFVGSLKKKVYLSTGMSNAEDISQAISVLTKSGMLREDITLLHCTSEYPAPFDEVNLNAIKSLKESFQLNVGYSDHTLGIEVSLAAVALGSTVIEKHFTIDTNYVGPDHRASITPQQLKELVIGIRNIEKSLGNGVKKVTKSESKNVNLVRKSIVAKTKILKGEIFTSENLTTKRAGFGPSPMLWYEFLGRISKRNYSPDEPIELT